MPMFRRSTISVPNKIKEKSRKEIKNVVVFGETGVGKSSLINLIADERIAETSSSAVGCTLDYKRYLLTIEDQRFAIWDTAGLDEGTQGTVPAERAEAYLKQLLHDLAKANGIDLLIYCVRGTRVRSALLTNYHLFYSAICRKKVPIAIVVTGLENQEGNMDTWWLNNEKQFSVLQMYFDSHACVTTLQSSMENATLRERRRLSKATLIKIITNTCRTEHWKPSEHSWANTVFSDIRAMFSPRQGDGVHIANVIMCDISRNSPVGPGIIKRSVTFQNPVSLSCIRHFRFRSPVSVVNENLQSKLPFDDAIKCTPQRLFRVYQVPRKQTPSGDEVEDTKKDMVVKRGADLLIFCAKKEGGESRDVKSQWEHFNITYGGDLSPQIVVVIGATDQRSAEQWWNDVVGGTVTKGDASISYWPANRTVTITEVEEAKERLRDLVNTCCIDCSKLNFAEDKQIFSLSQLHRLDKGRSISIPLPRMWPLASLKTSQALMTDHTTPVAHQSDILTTWGIWGHVSDRKDTARSNFISRTGTFQISGDCNNQDTEQDRLPFRSPL